MSLDDEIRAAERSGDSSARRMKDRLLPVDQGFRHVTMDGRTLRLHQITDEHLVNICKMRIRRGVNQILHERGGWGESLLRETNRLLEGWNFLLGRIGRGEVFEEATRRNLSGAWIGYLRGVVERRCDECGGRRRSVEQRGPMQRLQCATCARAWTFRCPTCGTETSAPDPRETVSARCFNGHEERPMAWVPRKEAS